jgi:brefeldin A-inhibited guanine nucleotide-exchange protein
MVAQGGLTQMVNHVFSRCNLEETSWSKMNGHAESAHSLTRRESVVSTDALAPLDSPSPTPRSPTLTTTIVETSGTAKDLELSGNPAHSEDRNSDGISKDGTSLQDSSENPSFNQSGDDNGDKISEAASDKKVRPPTNTVTLWVVVIFISFGSYNVYLCISDAFEGPNPNDHLPEAEHPSQGGRLNTNDLFVKDAFLVLRALCKLTMKSLNTERQIYFFFLLFHHWYLDTVNEM